MRITKRSLTGLGVQWVKRAGRLAERLMKSNTRFSSTYEVMDGYILSATRTGDRARAFVVDLPQWVLCPNGVRVPLEVGSDVRDGMSFPSAVRDLWQPDYLPGAPTPNLPALDRAAWRLITNTGYAFGGEGAGWEQVVLSQIASNVPYREGIGTTAHQVNGIGVVGFYNAATPSLQRFYTRMWASWTSADQESAFGGGAVPISSMHTRAIMFDTAFVDTLASGWVAIPRASAEYNPGNPPPWNTPQGLWGRSYRVKADTLSNTAATARYVMVARLFTDKVNGAADAPYHEAGAVLVATSAVTATLVDGAFQHSGIVLGDQVYSTTRPSRFRSPEACAVNTGVHVLLHAEVIRDESTPQVWFGENTYTVVCATATESDVALVFPTVDRDNDTTAARHFYGGASPDGVTSYFLYPAYNPSSPLMSVLSCDGAVVTLTDVVTPSQFQHPGWGFAATTGLVCNIGGGRLGFVVTIAYRPETGNVLTTPFDVTFCTYNTLTGAVAVVGQITLATLLYVPGYPCTAGGIGAVTVVQEEMRDENGAVISSAVLLWTTSSGFNTAAGGQNFVGATYVSYDSGATWHQISDAVGDPRGVVFVGSQLRPVTPGHAWLKPPEYG